MQPIAIPAANHDDHPDLIDAMFRLRASVFKDRLGWDVPVADGRDIDAFDRLGPTYILAVACDGCVFGCVRLLPSTGDTMVAAMFPDLLADGTYSPHPTMVESSRFCVDTSFCEGRGAGSLHDVTLTMFAAIIEWSMANGYTELVTGTDLRIERILKRAGWPMTRVGEPRPIGNTMSVVGKLPTDQTSLENVRPEGYRPIRPAHRRAT